MSKMLWHLQYTYGPDHDNKSGPILSAHLAHLRNYESRGLVLGGANLEPTDSASLFFEGEEATVQEFVRADPYFAAGLIKSHVIRSYIAVNGTFLHH
jgi:uncharacterized protein YciI